MRVEATLSCVGWVITYHCMIDGLFTVPSLLVKSWRPRPHFTNSGR